MNNSVDTFGAAGTCKTLNGIGVSSSSTTSGQAMSGQAQAMSGTAAGGACTIWAGYPYQPSPDLKIRRVENGYIVEAGFQTLVFPSTEKLCAWLIKEEPKLKK